MGGKNYSETQFIKFDCAGVVKSSAAAAADHVITKLRGDA
jgi:hypothetical protein